jgi:hypothetical protein
MTSGLSCALVVGGGGVIRCGWPRVVCVLVPEGGWAVSYEVPPPRGERGPGPGGDASAGYGGREPAYEDLYGRARERDPGQSYRPRRDVAQPAGRGPRGRSAGRGFAGRGWAELAAAVALVVVSSAVTWVVASDHYDRAAGSQGGSSSGVAAPETAAGALSAADTYFALYGAGQYAAVYPLIAPADRAVIAESVWTGLHQSCPVPGLTYQVKTPLVSGAMAVMAVGYSGAASAIGSEQVTFAYSGGRWYYLPSDMSVYRGHDLAQAVTAAKAAGLCS